VERSGGHGLIDLLAGEHLFVRVPLEATTHFPETVRLVCELCDDLTANAQRSDEMLSGKFFHGL